MSTTTRALGGLAIGAGVGVGGVGVGVGTILGALVRTALTSPPPVEDGPDPLLATPAVRPEVLEIRAADGNPIYAEAYGPADGDLIVLAHGWACNRRHWYAQINAFAEHSRVVVYDQRGHGRTPLGRRRVSMSVAAADLESVLQAVVPRGRRAVVGGHSMGGMGLLTWAQDFPDSIEKFARAVILNSSAAVEVVQNVTVVPEGLPWYTKPFERGVGRLVATAPVPLPHTALSPRLWQYVALNTQARLAHVEFCDEMIAECPAWARARWGAAMLDLNAWDGVRNLTVPTAVVVGTDDRLTPKPHSDAIAAELSDAGNLAEYLVLPHTGHMSNIEESRLYNRVVRDLLDATKDRAETVTA